MSLRWSLFAFTVACGAPVRAVDLPPPAPATCSVSNLDLEPLVVDLRADKRADLETALSRGVVAVAYDCDGVRVLPDCHAKGEYSFVGVTEKEQLVRLTSEVEVRANLPTSSTTLERTRKGRELDLALAIVGLRSIPTAVLNKDAFTGHCDGMTHFVRKVTVGAFGIGYASPTADVLFAWRSERSRAREKVFHARVTPASRLRASSFITDQAGRRATGGANSASRSPRPRSTTCCQ